MLLARVYKAHDVCYRGGLLHRPTASPNVQASHLNQSWAPGRGLLLPPSAKRSPAQHLGVFHQQPPVQARAANTHHQSLEHMFQPILAGHRVDDHTLSTKSLTVPALDIFLYLDLSQQSKCRVSLLMEHMLDMMG